MNRRTSTDAKRLGRVVCGLGLGLAFLVAMMIASSPALAHIAVATDPWTYDTTTHTPGDSWNFDYIVDPVNIVFYGSPYSDSAGKAADAVAETLSHLAGSGNTGGSGQHVHIDASPHGGSSCVPVAMQYQLSDPPEQYADERMHVRYFQSTFKDTDTYGWFTLSDAHSEWLHTWCSEHYYLVWHHTYSGDQYSSGFEVAEAFVWQEFYDEGHSYEVKDLENYYAMDVGHGATAINTRYAHYICIY